MKILAIAAHPDDIEGGCFGTLKKYHKQGAELCYLVLTNGEDAGSKKIRQKEQLVAAKLLNAQVKFANLKSAFLSSHSERESIKAIEEAIATIKPDIIFTHTKNDRHQDHRAVNESTISACRFYPCEIYFYEGVSSLRYFQPQVIHKIDDYFEDKLDVLKYFSSQNKKWYFNTNVVENVAGFRAAQFGFLGKAEAFEVGGIVK